MQGLEEMPSYSDFKESKIDWVGYMPSHWEVIKIKFIDLLNMGQSPDSNDCNIDGIGIPFLQGNAEFGKVHPTEVQWCTKPKKFAYSGDLLFSVRAPVGALNLADKTYAIGRGLAAIKVPCHTSSFRKYQLMSVVDSLKQESTGSTFEAISLDDLKNIKLCIPPKAERDSITNFLDQKTAQIDQAIAIKEQQISLLKERKQILIQQAVTRGLQNSSGTILNNGSAVGSQSEGMDSPSKPKMKDSGVEWIGEIPEHWEVIRLKYLFDEVNRRTKTGEETLFSLRMEIGLIPHNDVSDKHIPNESLVDYKVVEDGQLVMNRMRAAIGIFGIAYDYGLVSPDYAVFNISDDVVSEYYLALFKLPLLGTQFRLASKGMGTGSSGFMRLYTENFGGIKVPLPPKEEQKQLYDYINEVTIKTSSSIEHLLEQIEKLKEYKTTLINSAVTGKIKVA